MVELRRAASSDAGFLFRVYRETHIETFKALGPDMCETLLGQQSMQQEAQYDKQHPRLERYVILTGGKPVGRFYLSCDGEFVLVDIAVLPDVQKSGVGTWVLERLIKKAFASEKTVRLHVLQDNPAIRWYRSLGFAEVALKEPYVEMELVPR